MSRFSFSDMSDAVVSSDYSKYVVSRHVHDFGVSMTKQSDKDSADINYILKQFIRTGDPSLLGDRKPLFNENVDLSRLQDLHGYSNVLAAAFAQYDMLPAEVRARFKSPREFVDFASDPRNADHLVDMGLASRVEASPAVPTVQGGSIDSKGPVASPSPAVKEG